MEKAESHPKPAEHPVGKRERYEKPKVLMSYDKEELEAVMQPLGDGLPSPGGCGCGCSFGGL